MKARKEGKFHDWMSGDMKGRAKFQFFEVYE